MMEGARLALYPDTDSGVTQRVTGTIKIVIPSKVSGHPISGDMDLTTYQDGECNCGVMLESNLKRVFCPACGSECYLT